MRRFIAGLALVFTVAAACSPDEQPVGFSIPETDPAAVRALLDGSAQPVVLNVWASWCIPCRSEAPLLREAHRKFGDDVRFIGVAIRDRESSAVDFVSEFGLDFEHFLDSAGAVPAALGGRGVPLTFFFEAGGELRHIHAGVIDERSLALQIDELMRS